MSGLLEVLHLERIGLDLFQGAPIRTTLQRTYGGQVAGQSLVAATRTVDPRLAVHSLHGYFVRPGDPLTPTSYQVDRLREGRSFATRRVTALQHGKAIFTMSGSFHVLDPGPEHQDQAPSVPSPEALEEGAKSDDGFQEIHRVEWPDWELRRVPSQAPSTSQQVWLRHRTPLPDDSVLHACALAYASDMTLLGCTRLTHETEDLQMASLDHAVWFLRAFRADDWLLYDQTSPSAGHGRALAHGRIFDRGGRLVATVVQEGLMRFRRGD
jgi:acyl-CoA thioesterase-2